MSKFKAGDLALIVFSPAEANLGKVVELVEDLGSGAIYNDIGVMPAGFHRWLVKTVSGERDLVVQDTWHGLVVRERRVDSGPCRQEWLMPLRGDFQPEQQKSREVPA